MPTGPLGFPRLTSLGPFVEQDAEQEFIVEVKENVLPPATGLPRDLLDKGIVTNERTNRVIMKLIVREEVGSKRKGALGEIEESLQEITRDFQIATATYNYYPMDGVAMVGLVEVDEKFREMGIGTEIKERMIEDMKDRDIDIAFTIVASPEGRRLARRTGFKPSDEFFPDDDSIMVRRF